jgi:hypothetical protein
MITQQQYRRLLAERAQRKNMTVSAMKADVDRKTARKYTQAGKGPDELQTPHTWRTRPDPLAAAWPRAEQMLADAPELEAKALFEHLLAQPEHGLDPDHLRTFQRRVRRWRATRGPEQEIYFAQWRRPGDLLELDWTHAAELGVTIEGEPLDHLLCHTVLAYSNWEWAVRCQSESYLSLVGGLQASLTRLGRTPTHLLTDQSSAATHEPGPGDPQRGRCYNSAYLELCTHYDLTPMTIQVASPNEQGDIESANRHLKRRLRQRLLLRGATDFSTLADYDAFLVSVLEEANRLRQGRLEEELAVMKPLPPSLLAGYQELSVRVSSHSLVRVRNRTYSVPARLAGFTLRAQVHESEVQLFLGREEVLRAPRSRGGSGAVIDFRHLVGPLSRKPGAFANYQHREALYPSLVYRKACDELFAHFGPRGGSIEYLAVLRLAVDHGVEAVAAAVESRLGQGERWRALDLAQRLSPPAAVRESPDELVPELGSYDALMRLETEAAHAG